MTGGWYRMHRGWMDDPVFGCEAFTDREAWVWLVENAAWQPERVRIKGATVDLGRGELCFSQRFLAEKWRWSKSRVDRFLKRLAGETMILIRSKSGATAGHSAGQGQSIITICNYDKYQSREEGERGNADIESGATAGQQRGKEEEGKELKKEERTEEGARFAFFGRTIRLLPRDLDQWRAVYHAIPDIMAELTALDAWLQAQSEGKRKGWFHTVSGALNRKHQEILAARADAARPHEMGGLSVPC